MIIRKKKKRKKGKALFKKGFLSHTLALELTIIVLAPNQKKRLLFFFINLLLANRTSIETEQKKKIQHVGHH
jgi:hypothetical protein